MQLRLTESQLTQALAGLNPAERMELLWALEQRERLEADRPEDARPPLSSYLEPLTEHARLHFEHRDVHLKRLRSERLLADDADVAAYLQWHAGLWDEAGKLADADGFPASPPRAALEPAEPDPRPSLPADVARDVELTRGQERAARRSASAEPAPAGDKLEPFRGVGEWHLPPSHTDD